MTALIEDTAQKQGQHATKNDYWRDEGITVVRNKLPYGDYIFAPAVVVDTKRDLYELCANLTTEHKRFSKAAKLAHSCNSTLVILTENDEGVASLYDFCDWIEPEPHYRLRVIESHGRVKQRYKGTSLYKTCTTMQERYGMRFEFCTPDEAGRRVIEILKGGGQ